MKSLIKLLSFLLLFLIPLQSFAQIDSVRMYIFGHSLLDHRPPINPTPSDETTVAHWMHLLSEDQGDFYGATGQYGFLPQHDNLPPFSQWGYDIVPPVWESEMEPFADADFTTVFLTAGNFMQWQGPEEPYPGEGGVTPVSATETIIDWVDVQEEEITIYIYENWPDMAPYISSFPPTDAEFEAYNDYTLGDFHDWWIEYQDALLESRPEINIRMIPVGPIMAKLFRDTILTDIPVTELYEDDAPHGRPTVYFLASLISYMAIHNMPADENYDVPDIIHADVEANYADLIDFIWDELNAFNDNNGDSRVFAEDTSLPVEMYDFHAVSVEGDIILSWTTATELENRGFEVQYASNGLDFESLGFVEGNGTSQSAHTYSFNHHSARSGDHFYRLKQIDQQGSYSMSPIIHIRKEATALGFRLFPNPANDGLFNISLNVLKTDFHQIEIINILGEVIFQKGILLSEGQHQLPVDLSKYPPGCYLVKVENRLTGATSTLIR